MTKYIVDKRLLFKKGEQHKLIKGLKIKFKLKWSDISKVAGVSEQTVRVDWYL